MRPYHAHSLDLIAFVPKYDIFVLYIDPIIQYFDFIYLYAYLITYILFQSFNDLDFTFVGSIFKIP